MRALWLNVAVGVAYFTTGWLGLRLPYYGEHVTLIWAPVAIALAAVILAGPVVVPSIFLASFLVNVVIEPSHPLPSAIIAVGNTLGPAAAGLLLVRIYRVRPQLDRVRDAIAYGTVGVVGTSLITATLGTLALYTFGDAPPQDVPTAWLVWFGGDAVGLLVVGPLLLTALSRPELTLTKPISRLEEVAMGVTVAIFVTVVLAWGHRLVSLPYAFGVFYVWILLRAGTRAAMLSIAINAIALVAGTALGFGPFVVQSPREGMLSLWVYLAAVGSASLAVVALVSERNRALLHQRHLLAELDHRVKNTLATVVALAERSATGALDIGDYRTRFVGRVRAIARTHEGIARSNWRPMSVGDVVDMTLSPFDEGGKGQRTVNGDETTLAAEKVAALTMVLHELATNAAKYGAWSQPGGHVAVAWERNGDAVLRLTWLETGGPRLVGPPKHGFGLRLIEGVIGHELGGFAELDFAGAGLVCRFSVPLA